MDSARVFWQFIFMRLSSSMAPKTKSKWDLLTGGTRKNLSRIRLPSEKEVISYFRYQLEKEKTIRQSIQIVSDAVIEIWDQVGLPHMLKRNTVRRVGTLVATWKRLKKSYKHTNSIPSLNLRKIQLDNFFNIAVTNIEEELRKSAVRLNFWNQQVTSKIPIVFPESIKGNDTVCKQCQRQRNEKKKGKIEKKSRKQFKRNLSPSESLGKRRRLNPFTKPVIENLDRTRTSSRGAVGVVAAAADALGVDPQNLSLSRSTVQRKRKAVCFFYLGSFI